MSDEDEDTEGSDEDEEVIETFDFMTFNFDCHQELEWTTEKPQTRRLQTRNRGNTDTIKNQQDLHLRVNISRPSRKICFKCIKDVKECVQKVGLSDLQDQMIMN